MMAFFYFEEINVEPWRVHKFGGSSVKTADRMRQVANIVGGETNARTAVVLSACGGVTDALLRLVSAAERQEPSALDGLAAIRQRHVDIATALLDPCGAREYIVELDADCDELRGLLQSVRRIGAAPAALGDIVAGSGEIWSTRLFARHLCLKDHRTPVQWVDARDVVQVEWGSLGPVVRWRDSHANLARVVPDDTALTLVITGFIARDAAGIQTTLGRNGSDFSAAIFGRLLAADQVHIWTDVDGVLSADPRLVPDARVIDALSYEEAMELAYFGAKVIHPQTMAPAVEQKIPIWIRNTFAPEKKGTLISAAGSAVPPVKGISSIDRVALVNVEGAGMIGVPGTAERLFSSLREHGISVILISQGSSEHSICFAVPLPQAKKAERVVRSAFDRELANGQIQSVDVQVDCSVLAVVGDGMAGTPGIAAKVFGALGTAGVNVRAIAQGASERNISLVIESRHESRALRAVHSSFYLSPHTISIGLIGPGLVGGAFLDQLASQADRFRDDCNLDLRVRGMLTTRRMLLGEPAIALGAWRDRLAESAPADLAAFEAHVHADHLPHTVIVDCTASSELVQHYPRWLRSGMHIVTPNKKANSACMDFYRELHDARREGGAHYLYETTVGAALPIIQTLRDLRETGDEIRCIEGILSGTLAYLFNVWHGVERFSAIVRDAMDKGYTEPDPRDDLSGTDVARKLIILGREMGLRLELSGVALESLVPDDLAACSREEFLERLEELDGPMQARFEAAQDRGRVLRYVGALDAATASASVGLVELERSHPFANINFTDNVVRFVTARYDRNPLVVQGPGAGPAVTAGGVFADLLRACAYLGAKL
jgi:bifunctional aspartokinase / homoserine dehydrogenase 1